MRSTSVLPSPLHALVRHLPEYNVYKTIKDINFLDILQVSTRFSTAIPIRSLLTPAAIAEHRAREFLRCSWQQ